MSSDDKKELAEGFWVGEWFAEPMLNRVVREEEHVQLEPKVMAVLRLMAERPGKTVTKEAFMDRVWTDTVVADDVLPRCISQLRKVFDDDARDPDYIETIRKTGYRLIAPVRVPDTEEAPHEISAAAQDAAQDEKLADTLRGLSGKLGAMAVDTEKNWVVVAGGIFERRWLLVTIGILLAVLIGVGIGTLLFPGVLPAGQSANPLNAVPLTSFSGHELDPALSPDGRQLAFTWEGEEQGARNVYLIQRGADTPLRLTQSERNEWDPTWSSDGQYIAFVRALEEGGSGVFIVSSIGGSERQLATFPAGQVQSIAWSPDPSQQSLTLTLKKQSHQPYRLYWLPIEADTLVQLTDPPVHSVGDTSPTFSPSGDRIAFTRTLIDDIQDIYVISAEGGAATQVTSDSIQVAGLDWTSDGEQLIFASDRDGTSGLWRVAADGGTPEWIATAGEGAELRYPSLARKGQRLAYAQQSRQVDLWRVREPTRYTEMTTERVISSTRWDSDPDIAPGGNRVAFVSRRSGYPEIWTATPDGSELKQVTTLEVRGTQTPRWSPDGERIAFSSRQQGHSDIYVIGEGGVRPERLTQDPAEDLFPAWSRDGEYLYFTSNRSGTWEIWKLSAEDGEPVQVTQGGATAAQEHPDGSALYIMRTDTTGLWSVPLADTSHTIDFPPASGTDSTIVSPDSLDGLATRATPRQVVPSLMSYDRANWHVTDRGIYFLRRTPTATVVSFYRFSTQRVSSVFPLQEVPHGPGFAVSPEGDWFLYTRAELRESDIMLVRDFQ